MIVLIVCLTVFYLLSMAVCTLSARALFGEREAKIVTTLAFVPIVNLVLAVVIIMLFSTLYKENKNTVNTNTVRKEEPKK